MFLCPCFCNKAPNVNNKNDLEIFLLGKQLDFNSITTNGQKFANENIQQIFHALHKRRQPFFYSPSIY